MDLIWIGLGESEFIASCVSLGKVDLPCISIVKWKDLVCLNLAPKSLSGKV